jgi:hypothetical protein
MRPISRSMAKQRRPAPPVNEGSVPIYKVIGVLLVLALAVAGALLLHVARIALRGIEVVP